ncbi:hypothetical protein Leryth_012842 [Lithospermum erythrorhizon]|nr:hypothetical protein Leryth_012842 [Lithospermum erythrorhizon]
MSSPNQLQGLTDLKACNSTSKIGARDYKIPLLDNSVHPAVNGCIKTHSKNQVQQSSHGMPPPPPKLMPPPVSKPVAPPPPRFNASSSTVHENKTPAKSSETVPDTLIKLMEYGEDDDDDDSEGTSAEPQTDDDDSEGTSAEPQTKSSLPVVPKPFWAP